MCAEIAQTMRLHNVVDIFHRLRPERSRFMACKQWSRVVPVREKRRAQARLDSTRLDIMACKHGPPCGLQQICWHERNRTLQQFLRRFISFLQ